MNKKLAVISIICLTIAAAISCKKSAKTSVQHDNITGKWRKTRVVIDTNGNGILDTAEMMSVTSYDSTHVLVFNSDGSGVITYQNTSIGSFNWSLENNNTYLKVVYSGTGSPSTFQHIDLLTKSAMTLKDSTGIALEWDMFTKQ